MSLKSNLSGSWTPTVNSIKVKSGGVWKRAGRIHVKKSGVWETVDSVAPPTPQDYVTGGLAGIGANVDNWSSVWLQWFEPADGGAVDHYVVTPKRWNSTGTSVVETYSSFDVDPNQYRGTEGAGASSNGPAGTTWVQANWAVPQDDTRYSFDIKAVGVDGQESGVLTHRWKVGRPETGYSSDVYKYNTSTTKRVYERLTDSNFTAQSFGGGDRPSNPISNILSSNSQAYLANTLYGEQVVAGSGDVAYRYYNTPAYNHDVVIYNQNWRGLVTKVYLSFYAEGRAASGIGYLVHNSKTDVYLDGHRRSDNARLNLSGTQTTQYAENLLIANKDQQATGNLSVAWTKTFGFNAYSNSQLATNGTSYDSYDTIILAWRNTVPWLYSIFGASYYAPTVTNVYMDYYPYEKVGTQYTVTQTYIANSEW